MRLNIHKVMLKGVTRELPITIATADFPKIPDLVNRHRTLYTTMLKEPIQSFEVKDTLYTMNMSEEQYAEELMMVDIVDEDTTQHVIRNV